MPFTDLLQHHGKIETPALLVDEERLKTNIRKMQQMAQKYRVAIRPHVKTHKSIFIARMQVEEGACGLTVAKLSEAEIFFAAGFDDIFIANQITHVSKIRRLWKLVKAKRNIIVGIDHPEQITLLERECPDRQLKLSVRIEIDSGLHRCGVTPGNLLREVARRVANSPVLELEGVFTHAGQAYQAKTEETVRKIGQTEGQIMATAAAQLKEMGLNIRTVSVGSTPTAPFSAENPAVNEIRPGNYVFYDAMQLALHSASLEDCSLFVLATVVSRPAADRVVIDAGSKALHTDGAGITGHFGLALNLPGKVVRVSEEHGVLQVAPDSQIAVGAPVLVLPNHACAVVNLFDQFWLISKNQTPRPIAIDARGKSQ